MKLLRQCLTTAILLLSLPAIAQHSYSVSQIGADSAWIKLQAIKEGMGNDTVFFASRNKWLKYREEGLKFWKVFPKDLRRYSWLFTILSMGYDGFLKLNSNKECNHLLRLRGGRGYPNLNYSWPLDYKLLTDWEIVYPNLKKDFLLYCLKNPEFEKTISSQTPARLLQLELESFLYMSLNKEYRRGNKIDLKKLKSLLLECVEYQNKGYTPGSAYYRLLKWMSIIFVDRYLEYGLSPNDMQTFFSSIKADAEPILRNWTIQQMSLLALREQPMLLKHKSINGDIIDLEKLRGKVVLVDFWSVWCTSCVARMPAIKVVYDKYKDQGFEVVSACANNEDKLEEVKRIEKKIGAGWPVLMIGWGAKTLAEETWNKYGFQGVPQYLLLDKSGKLAMYNDKLATGDFEPLVKQLLAEKYNSN